MEEVKMTKQLETIASPHCDIDKLEDGEEIMEVDGWCDLCSYSFGGSMTRRPAIHLQGKFYHPSCYPTAVNIYIANQRLKNHKDK